MKVGDLVKCLWQPTVSRISKKGCVEMGYTIKDEYGIIVKDETGTSYQILFPKFNYTHTLAASAFEVISENR